MKWALYLLVVLDVVTAIYLVNWGPFPLVVDLGASTAYLNVYVHVPASTSLYVMAVLALAFALWGALKGASARVVKFMDFSAYSVAVLGWYSFISGTIWAAESWGAPFALDPRQLSVLVLALMFSLYPAIRRGVEDPERSVKLAQTFVMAGFVLAMLSFVAPVIAPFSLHPAPGSTVGGTLGEYMGIRILLVMALLLALLVLGSAEWAPWIYLAGAAVAVALMYPWFFYSPVRVLNITNTSIVLEGGRVINISPSSILTPAAVNGTPTLPRNFVAVIGDKVVLVRHYSAYVNTALYFAAMALIFKLRERL